MADNAGPSRPRGRLGAFSGGPFGIGWAPWAIGVGALALGIFFFMRRTPATAQQAQGTAAGGALPISQPYPYPTGVAPQGPASNPSAAQLQGIWIRPQGQIRGAPTADPSSPSLGSPTLGTTLPLGQSVSDPSNPQGRWYAVSGGTYSGGWAWSGDITLKPQDSNLSAQQMSSMGGVTNFAA